MGMDVFGKAPVSTEGEYFRNSVWWWHPLAEYITDSHPDLAAACTLWHTNDGDGLDAADAVALADALTADLDSGAVALYEAERNVQIASLPRETCRLCAGTGTRSDDIGIEMGFTARRWCNGCDGKGTVQDDRRMYQVALQDVQEFADFVRASGGFEIL